MYLCLTEFFEMELTICISIDLVLNNLQKLICHKKPNQPKSQPTYMFINWYIHFWLHYINIYIYTHTYIYIINIR